MEHQQLELAGGGGAVLDGTHLQGTGGLAGPGGGGAAGQSTRYTATEAGTVNTGGGGGGGMFAGPCKTKQMNKVELVVSGIVIIRYKFQ